ncbi:MAG TPA: aspartate dehydrogenase domain-containing protein [bacterium]|nr:aspartate dehydrogenase domain-containing protein [bacterium]
MPAIPRNASSRFSMQKINVGLIGCGTIGSALAKVLLKDFQQQVSFVGISEIQPERARRFMRKFKKKIPLLSIDKLIQKCDLILEAASSSVSASIAAETLRRGKQVLIMSVGGLLGDQKKRFRLSGKSGGRIWIPSGALAGIDGLLAANEGKIRKVKLVTEKPPASLREAPYFRRHRFPVIEGSRPICLFKGNALQAVQGFPQNINVAAILSLAGLGPQKTQVEIWTSRRFRTNRHRILIEGDFGRIETLTENIPSKENPKTSALAVHSAVACLRKIFSPFRIGT